MAEKKTGKKHTLLLYRRMMDRLWPSTLLLALLLLGIWGLSEYNIAQVLEYQDDTLLLVTGGFCLAFSLFAFIVRKSAYVQAASDHLKLVTPFYRVNISYQRMRSLHPALIMRIFPAGKQGWAENNYLEPFSNFTALILELNSYPLNPRLLRLFFPRQIFSPYSRGLVLLVDDWMALSTEVDSLSGTWLQLRASNKSKQNPSYNLGSGRVW